MPNITNPNMNRNKLFQYLFDHINDLKMLGTRLTTPKQFSLKDGIAYWQEKVFLKILSVAVVLGLVAYIPSVTLCIKEKYWSIVFIDTVIYGFVIFLLLKRNISFSFRIACFPVMIYLIGLVVITTLGPFGDGPIWLFCFPVITGMLMGYKKAFGALMINAITVILIGCLIYLNLTSQLVLSNFELWHIATGNTMERWIAISLNFMLLNIVTTLSITTILKGLQKSHEELEIRIKERTEDLSKTNMLLFKEIDEHKQAKEALNALNKTLDKKVQRRTEELNILNEHLIHAEEKTRIDLANDLHDTVAQTLALSVSKIKNLKEKDAAFNIEPLSTIQSYIEQSLIEIRQMINQLCPQILKDFDIATAIGFLIEETNKKFDADIIFIKKTNESITIDEAIKITLYRAINEIILNVLKHSGVKKAKVELQKNKDNIILKIEDSGIGFDPAEVKITQFNGFGLFSLSRRIENLGGNIKIKSMLNKGTEVKIFMPVNQT